MLQKELSRYRKNMAKLIDMHNDAAAERDELRIELKRTAARLSSTLVENTALGNRNRGLETCREQLEAINKPGESARLSPLPLLRTDRCSRTNRHTGATEGAVQ
ncbi:hypothetical protein ACI2KS_13830 [Pseudomonas sp. NPDC087358]|uniref:hypothetical protein n=1 Tax=Pseudomonas sp. NPDC087358 TaxID=3364439 RepID=UPI00384D2808